MGNMLENQKTAEKKTAEKRAAEKKAVERKTAVKRNTEKETAEKQAAVKRNTEKEAAEKQAAVKRTTGKKVTEKQAAVRRTAEKEAAEKQPAAKKTAEKKAAEKQPAVKKTTEKTTVQRKATGTKTAAKKKSKQGKRPADANNAVRKKSGSTAKKKAANGNRVKRGVQSGKAEREVRDGESIKTRSDSRDAQRARRREERLRKVRRQKIIMAVSGGVILVSVLILIVMFLPPVKYLRNIFMGDNYLAKADYVSAVSAYEKAVELNDTSAEAYHGMADALTAQDKISEAESIVYTGWEKTQDEVLLHYYCTLVLNEAVAQINAKNCTLDTVDKCVHVLELDAANEDALSLMHTCYERLFKVTEENDTCTLFFDADAAQESCGYDTYEQLLRRVYAVYQAAPSEELKNILAQYAMIDMPKVHLSMNHIDQYIGVLTEISGVLSDTQIAETLACLTKAKEIEDYFAQAFDEFAQGNYAYARELITEDTYQQIRDQFINEDSGCWKGSVYIPVSQEQLVLNRDEGTVTFSFLSFEEYDNPQGIITIWGSKQEDDGTQRSVISYEPANENSSEFPHTEYTIQYLYSNVKIGGKYVPQMNYRFDTKVTTEEGTTTIAVGDWGGEHEFEIDY